MKKYAYMQKNGIAVTKIANYLLTCQVGDRINSIREFAKNYDVGHGTVQTAIDYLESVGACLITKNGNKGSFLTAIDHHKLISASGVTSINGVMAMSHVNWYLGFAKGVEEVLSNHYFRTHITQLPGSINRIDALLEDQYDFAIVPTDFLATIGDKIHQLEIILDMDNEKLINFNSVISLKENNFNNGAIPRMGVDFTNQQHLYLSQKYYSTRNVTIVPISFDSIFDALISKNIDLAIIDGVLEEDNALFQVIDVISPWESVISKREALVVRKSNKAVINFMRTVINVDKIISVQRQIVQGYGLGVLSKNNK